MHKDWQKHVRKGHKKLAQYSLLCIVLHKKELKVHKSLSRTYAATTLRALNDKNA